MDRGRTDRTTEAPRGGDDDSGDSLGSLLAAAGFGRSIVTGARLDVSTAQALLGSTSPITAGLHRGLTARLDVSTAQALLGSTSPITAGLHRGLTARLDVSTAQALLGSTSPITAGLHRGLTARLDVSTAQALLGSTSPITAGLHRGLTARLDVSTAQALLGSTSPITMGPFGTGVGSALMRSGWAAGIGRQTSDLWEVLRAHRKPPSDGRPPNLRGLESVTLRQLRAVVLDDGIPLYGIPRTPICERLISAPDRSARRTILGRSWKPIVRDCQRAIAGHTSPDLQQERTYLAEALAALEDGHSSAAQALGANLLDTIVTKRFAADSVVLKPGRRVKTPEGYDRFVVRKFLALAPIWSAYQQFFPAKGHDVPREFARHATAHAVGPRQFSRRNAVQAVMLVTSVLCYLEDGGLGSS